MIDHLATWKTLIECEQSEEAVVEHLRSARSMSITRFDGVAAGLAEIAA